MMIPNLDRERVATSNEFDSEATDGIGKRYGQSSATCPDAYTDVPEFSAELGNWLVVGPWTHEVQEPRLRFDSMAEF